MAVLATSLSPARSLAAPQTPGQPKSETTATTQTSLAPQTQAPSLGEGFDTSGRWLVPGTVSLDWDDVEAASGFELMWRSPEGWALLSGHGDTSGVAVEFDGSSALVGGLPEHLERFWFAVRARNAFGISQWSPSFQITVPPTAVIPLDADPVFDPFTAPTRSAIDLERLGEAAATITPGRAACVTAPALDVAGISMVDAPAGLGDPDAPLTVAEVVRIAGGCLLVEYADLEARTVNEVRALLAAEASVHSVGAPARGLSIEHDSAAHGAASAHTGAHHDDGGGKQWHLPQPTMRGLWDAWEPANPVTVAVLDTGVDATHPDLADRVVAGGLDACHRVDSHSHGTHVAGIIAAREGNGAQFAGTAGLAPSARILPVQILHTADCEPSMTATAAVAAAVNAGARVINMSFKWKLCEDEDSTIGGIPAEAEDTCDPDVYDSGDADDSFELALRAASMLGVVAITSVGNDGQDQDKTGPPHQQNGPAVYPDVISIAAVDENGQKSTFSTANELVDVAAPGGKILSSALLLACVAEDTDGDGADDRWTPLECGLVDPPDQCTNSIALRERTDVMPEDCAPRIAYKWGTSMAAPFVSGVVAHMLNRYPEATVDDVRKALRESAFDAGSDGRDDEFGHGIVDPDAAVAALGNILAMQSLAGPVGGFRSVVAGGRFSCGVSGNWRVRCWGDQGVVDSVPAGQAFSEVSVPVGDVRVGCGLRPLGTGDERGTVLCLSDMSGQVLEFVPQGAFTELAVGRLSTCGLRPAGGVVCWNNQTGERVLAVPSGEFTEISGGWEHWCGLREDGTAVCWGDNSHGQTDVVAGSPPFSGISAGGKHTCAVTYLSGVRCWGDAGAIAGVPGTLGFRSVDSGFEHTCAIQNESMVFAADSEKTIAVCWGANGYGQADVPDVPDVEDGQEDTEFDLGFVEVSAGWRHSCGLVKESRIKTARAVCWGDNSYQQAPAGRLTSLSLTDSDGEELISFDPAVTEYEVIADPGNGKLMFAEHDDTNSGSVIGVLPAVPGNPSGGYPVVLADGAVFEVTVTPLFGFGVSRTYRIEVGTLPRLASLSVRPAGLLCVPACPLLELSPVFDPGVGAYRVVVAPDVAQVTVGYLAQNLDHLVSVSPLDADPTAVGHQLALTTNSGFVQLSSGTDHTCGVRSDGTVRCWGSDGFGKSTVPTGTYVSVSGGWGHTCAVSSTGAAVCWGDNYWGQSNAPSGTFTAVSAGWGHSCGLTTTGTARCWGFNFSGQSSAPSGTFTAVVAGGNHSCAITGEGALRCWGLNNDRQASPPSGTYTAIAAGWRHNCAIKTDATLACWGDNGSRQATAPSGTYTAVSAGQEHSCGVKTDGTAVCWGNNGSGQLTVPSGTFTNASAGEGHSCGLTTTGTVLCWGTGTATRPAAPATVTITITSASDSSTVYSIGIDRTASRSAARSAQSHSNPGRALIDEASRGPRSASAQCPTSAPDAQIQLTDPTLRAEIARQLGKTDGQTITASELAALTELSLSPGPDSTAVTDLSGLEHATALETLDISDNDIVDLAPLVCLTNLATLNAAGNQITDLAPLRGLTNLKRLYLHDNAITNITPLGGLTGLVGLDLSFNQITDISTLRGLTGLTQLGIGGNQITDLSPLAGLTALEALYLFDNDIADIADLSGLASLDVLWADGNQITSTTNLAALTSLGYLDIRYNEIADTAPLDTLTGTVHTQPQNDTPAEIPDPSLRTAVQTALGLGAFQTPTIGQLATLETLERIGPQGDPAPITSLEGLQHAVNLKTLTLRSNQITNITPIAGLTKLQRLSLQANAVTDITPLNGLTSLTTLNLGGNQITNITALTNLTELEWLTLSSNQITDISALANLDELYFLRLTGNQITNITPLAGLDSINNLQLFGNQITDITPLAGLDTLRYLDLRQNQITNTTPLSEHTELLHLYLSYNQITDLTPLNGLTSLTHLFLTDNQITNVAPLSTLTSLQHLYLRNNPVTDLTPLNGLTDLTTHR